MTIGIVGGGMIGRSWAMHFARLGRDVGLYDPDPAAGDRLAAELERTWPVLTRLGLRGAASPGRIAFSPDLGHAIAGASTVIEAAPEDLNLKRATFAEIEDAVDQDTLILSSSSSLMISDIRAECRHPARCLLAHPYNPPHLIPLVEVAGGDETDPFVARAMTFLRDAEKKPVLLRRELPGHLANRLASALWREAVHLVAEGVASVADIDDAVRYGPGLRWAVMGPHMTYHLGGGAGGMAHYLDHLGPSQERRWATLGAPALTPEVRAMLIAGVADEAQGQTIEELEARRDAALVALLADMETWEGDGG